MKINLLLIVALILNLIIICSVSIVFKKLKDKKEIFKYYTYVQSLLALVVSIIFVIYFITLTYYFIYTSIYCITF